MRTHQIHLHLSDQKLMLNMNSYPQLIFQYPISKRYFFRFSHTILPVLNQPICLHHLNFSLSFRPSKIPTIIQEAYSLQDLISQRRTTSSFATVSSSTNYTGQTRPNSNSSYENGLKSRRYQWNQLQSRHQ